MDFLKRIDFKQVLIHCLAGVLLVFVAALLGNISDIEYIHLVEEKGVKEAFHNHMNSERLFWFNFWYAISSFFGVLFASVISVVFFIKRKLTWLNSVLVFIILYFTNYFGFISSYRKQLAFLLDFGLIINVLIMSSILIIIAFSLYFYSYRISKENIITK